MMFGNSFLYQKKNTVYILWYWNIHPLTALLKWTTGMKSTFQRKGHNLGVTHWWGKHSSLQLLHKIWTAVAWRQYASPLPSTPVTKPRLCLLNFLDDFPPAHILSRLKMSRCLHAIMQDWQRLTANILVIITLKMCTEMLGLKNGKCSPHQAV